MDQIYMTKEECESFIDLMDVNFFEIIRQNTDIDSMEWLTNLIHVYGRAKALLDKKED